MTYNAKWITSFKVWHDAKSCFLCFYRLISNTKRQTLYQCVKTTYHWISGADIQLYVVLNMALNYSWVFSISSTGILLKKEFPLLQNIYRWSMQDTAKRNIPTISGNHRPVSQIIASHCLTTSWIQVHYFRRTIHNIMNPPIKFTYTTSDSSLSSSTLSWK